MCVFVRVYGHRSVSDFCVSVCARAWAMAMSCEVAGSEVLRQRAAARTGRRGWARRSPGAWLFR
eukprot:768847-Rhodomonas_salina.1